MVGTFAGFALTITLFDHGMSIDASMWGVLICVIAAPTSVALVRLYRSHSDPSRRRYSDLIWPFTAPVRAIRDHREDARRRVTRAAWAEAERQRRAGPHQEPGCPRCGAIDSVSPVSYGLFVGEPTEGVTYAGCVQDLDSPNYRCTSCGTGWAARPRLVPVWVGGDGPEPVQVERSLS